MKIIQIPFTYYPDPVGGTEIYVEGLSNYLLQKGIEVIIAAPGIKNDKYRHNELNVRRFAVSGGKIKLNEIYGEGDAEAAFEFDRILEEEQPDIIHIHAFTSAVSTLLLQKAKQREIPVVFTYHTPTVSCQRGTLLKWGKGPCDGKIVISDCAGCSLHGHGLNEFSSKLLGKIPTYVGKALEKINLRGGMWTALRTTDLTGIRHSSFQLMMSEANHIVAVCDWVKDLLVINGVPEKKISVIRQPLCHEIPDNKTMRKKEQGEVLKVAFLGRLDPVKGIDVLIKAFQFERQLSASLDIYGVAQEGSHSSYVRVLRELAKNDPRIRFKEPAPHNSVVSLLSQYDVLAVPSQGLETGPLVVLEAFAAGIPVIGSNLGGITELVEHKINGILVEYNSVKAWSRELKRFSEENTLLIKLQAGIKPPQDLQTVGTEMLKIYSAINQKN